MQLHKDCNISILNILSNINMNLQIIYKNIYILYIIKKIYNIH